MKISKTKTVEFFNFQKHFPNYHALKHADDSFGDVNGDHELWRDWQKDRETGAEDSFLQFDAGFDPFLKHTRD